MVVYRHTHNVGRILIRNLQAGLGLVLVATFLLATATLCGKARRKKEEEGETEKEENVEKK